MKRALTEDAQFATQRSYYDACMSRLFSKIYVVTVQYNNNVCRYMGSIWRIRNNNKYRDVTFLGKWSFVMMFPF